MSQRVLDIGSTLGGAAGEKQAATGQKASLRPAQARGVASEKQAATSQKARVRPTSQAEQRRRSRPQQGKKQECGRPARQSSDGEVGRN